MPPPPPTALYSNRPQAPPLPPAFLRPPTWHSPDGEGPRWGPRAPRKQQQCCSRRRAPAERPHPAATKWRSRNPAPAAEGLGGRREARVGGPVLGSCERGKPPSSRHKLQLTGQAPKKKRARNEQGRHQRKGPPHGAAAAAAWGSLLQA